MNNDKNIYFDYQATTPVDPRVLDKMLPFFKDVYGNPHSRNHPFGWEAEETVEIARENVSKIIGANPKEIIFTSGATESNNLAIKGLAEFYGDKRIMLLLVLLSINVFLSLAGISLKKKGFDVTYLPVKPDGLIDLEELDKSIKENTMLVSIMGVHNEIGVIQPLEEIGKICRKRGVFFSYRLCSGYWKN